MKAAPSAGVGMMALVLGCGVGAASVRNVTTATYPEMAPLAHYLSASRADEIALARSAAPAAISREAEILTLGPKGYETAVPGKNHFVCLVVRPWDNHFDSSDFWNPKVRAPHCFNAAGARSVLPTYLKRTEWALAGLSRAQMLKRTQAALRADQIPVPEVGSIAYMMSKEGYLGDDVGGHWHPHLMFYLPRTKTTEWGANLRDSPVYGDSNALEPLTVFAVPVTHWSDGTPAEGRIQ
jgi:hypothetical protein